MPLIHACLGQLTSCRLCPRHWDTATQTSVYLEGTQITVSDNCSVHAGKGKVIYSRLGEGVCRIFGEMCSYKVRNLNLNFGGRFLGLGG